MSDENQNCGPRNNVGKHGNEASKTQEISNPDHTIDNYLGDQSSSVQDESEEINPEAYDIPHPAARRWLAKRSVSKLSDTSVPSYESTARMYLTFLNWNKTTLIDASIDDLLRFIEFRVSIGSAKNTVKLDCTIIKDLYQYINTRTNLEPIINNDVFREHVNLNRYNYDGGFARGDINQDEVELLFENLDIRDRLMVYFAVGTGVRNSDIRSLRYSDIDYDEMQICIPEPKNGDSYDVEMSYALGTKLNTWKKIGRNKFNTSKLTDYVFPSARGKKLETNEALNDKVVNGAWKAGIQEIIATARVVNSRNLRDVTERKIHRVTVHTLRHTYITMLADAGVPPEAQRLAANHKNLETTKIYRHTDDSEWRNIVRSLLPY